MIEYKVLLTGSVGAGKTTAVNALSQKSTVCTDVDASDITLNRKPTTTVAMDYGVYETGSERIHVYGTPGQERFNFMWDILSIGAAGLVVLVDNSRENPVQDMAQYLKQFPSFVNQGKVVIGVTCADLSPSPEINQYSQELSRLGYDFPVCQMDARSGGDVLNTVYALIETQNRQAA